MKLLKATHGQWLYWNVQIHDTVLGTQVTIRKEAIQKKIEEQMELGEAGLLEEDNWMLEVNLRGGTRAVLASGYQSCLVGSNDNMAK